jgi:acyl-coenzyme A synthetase/AMP-(fatty) acid ligase
VISQGNDRFSDFFRHRPTQAVFVPTMLSDLLALRHDGEKLEDNFELTLAGGFLPLSLAELAVRRLTPNLKVQYGLSEVAAVMRSRFRSLEDLHWLMPYNSKFEIVDDAGIECAAGVEGELRIRMRDFDRSCYLDDPEANAKFYRDGCFYPGDLAVRRDDGRIRVLGRTDDVVNVRGWKVPVAPVEELVQRRLGVDSVCIFSEQDKSGEELIVIAVECDHLPPEEMLAAAIKDRQGFDRVRWASIESFPRTEGGMSKVNRRKLRMLLE